MAFHEGCAAYAVSLNASATMTMDGMTMDMGSMTMSMTGMASATASSASNDAGAAHKHSNTGPIVGGVVGGLLGLLLILVGGWLGWKHFQSKNNTHATPYQDSKDHGGDHMVQHTATPYYGPGDNKTGSVYINNGTVIGTPQQQPADLVSNRLSYASHQPYPYSPAVSSPQAPFATSASRDYDTSMFAALGPASQVSSPPSQYGGNSTSSGGATTQAPLMVHETGQTWTTNPITPPPPFVPSSSPGLPPGARGPEHGRPIGYTSGVPEAMSIEGEKR